MYKLYALFDLLKLKNIVTQKGGATLNTNLKIDPFLQWRDHMIGEKHNDKLIKMLLCSLCVNVFRITIQTNQTKYYNKCNTIHNNVLPILTIYIGYLKNSDIHIFESMPVRYIGQCIYIKALFFTMSSWLQLVQEQLWRKYYL